MRTIIGVMGGGSADEATSATARTLGALIAEQDWALLTGGRDCGVMRAASEGASSAGGLVIGVLPDDDTSQMTPSVEIPILTGMGDARNVVNVLSSRVVIAMQGGAGTVSEIAHALKLGRPVVTLAFDTGVFFEEYRAAGRLVEVTTPGEAVEAAARFLET
jgi:uncharacterized protein (TIGR00725 family)